MSAETISFEVPERCETLEDGLRKIAKIITSEQFISKAREHLNEGDGSIYRISIAPTAKRAFEVRLTHQFYEPKVSIMWLSHLE